jgi:hypothetical protein
MNVKHLALAGFLFAGLLAVNAAEKVQAGPKGGRILGKTTPTAEFLVEKDHTVSIHFYDGALKPISAAGQSVTVIADTKTGKQKVDFEKKGDVLVSKTKLPEGDGYHLVVQLRRTSEEKPQNFRFTLDLSSCGGCKLPEYACTCHE